MPTQVAGSSALKALVDMLSKTEKVALLALVPPGQTEVSRPCLSVASKAEQMAIIFTNNRNIFLRVSMYALGS